MNFKAMAAAVVASFCFAACNEYDPGEGFALDYTDDEMKVLNSFTQNFTRRYGQIDPNHDWGFGELEAQTAELQTRAVNTERNMWAVPEKEDPNDMNKITGWTTKGGMEVPGFPSVVDGNYYVEGNDASITDVYNSEEALLATGRTFFQPVGDVTQEEILYVSEWFRTHQYPESESVELTEFFIQTISQDKDRTEYPNGEHKPSEVPIYKDGVLQNGTNPINYGMDYFNVSTSEMSAVEHINNFNAGKMNHIQSTNPSSAEQPLSDRTIMYWTTNGGYTTKFSYHNSDDGKIYENYVLVHLTFTGPQTGLQYDGYYLAFDYQLNKMDSDGKTATVAPDGYYSNWIVKLSPGYGVPGEVPANKTESKRVMCEDLGNTYDFDFNDLVFDVYYTYEENEGVKNNITAQVTVQAAGGTLPIYIGQVDDAHEAHKILGASSTNVAFNVGGERRNASSISIPCADTNPNNLNIYVGSAGNAATERVTLLPKSGESASIAPQKICVPVTTKWLKENQQIEYGYPEFGQWVSDQQTEWWNGTIVSSYLY